MTNVMPRSLNLGEWVTATTSIRMQRFAQFKDYAPMAYVTPAIMERRRTSGADPVTLYLMRLPKRTLGRREQSICIARNELGRMRVSGRR